jgi:hypothetical protein
MGCLFSQMNTEPAYVLQPAPLYNPTNSEMSVCYSQHSITDTNPLLDYSDCYAFHDNTQPLLAAPTVGNFNSAAPIPMPYDILNTTRSLDVIHRDLAYTVRPVIYLHPDEKYFPLSVDDVLPPLYGESDVIDIPSGLVKGSRRFAQIPVYYHCYRFNKRVITDDRIHPPGSLLAIHYGFFYPTSGPYEALGVKVGGHPGDFEHITALIDIIDAQHSELVGVFFAAHNSEGVLVHARHIEIEGSRIVVYSAKGSHASFSKAGRFHRAKTAYILADHTAAGAKWDSRVMLSMEEAKWAAFKGVIGNQKIFMQQSWYEDI